MLTRPVALSKFDEMWLPRFEPLHCAIPECRSIIRGSMFVSRGKDKPGIICEDCYRSHHYGSESYAKAYKHCILSNAITPDVGRKICHCSSIKRFDGEGSPVTLFPLKEEDSGHLNVNGIGSIQCSLLKLGESVALAKYKGLQSVVGVKPPSSKSRDLTKLASRNKTKKNATNASPSGESQEKGKGQREAGSKPSAMTMVTGISVHDPEKRDAVSSTTNVTTEAAADRDIPLFFRKYTEKYPFGNVHMALRVGPLVIENGVSQ